MRERLPGILLMLDRLVHDGDHKDVPDLQFDVVWFQLRSSNKMSRGVSDEAGILQLRRQADMRLEEFVSLGIVDILLSHFDIRHEVVFREAFERYAQQAALGRREEPLVDHFLGEARLPKDVTDAVALLSLEVHCGQRRNSPGIPRLGRAVVHAQGQDISLDDGDAPKAVQRHRAMVGIVLDGRDPGTASSNLASQLSHSASWRVLYSLPLVRGAEAPMFAPHPIT